MYLKLIPPLKITDLHRFWCNIQKTDHCHLWIGTCSGGKPEMSIGPKSQGHFGAARLAYKIAYGIDPGSQIVLHSCQPLPDNPMCVNPLHLRLGNNSDNMVDMWARGRLPSCRKLDYHDAPRIRQLHAEGMTKAELAVMFRVSDSMIHLIITNQRWNI